PGVGGGEDRHLYARVCREERFPDAAQRRRAADRRLRARPRGRRVVAAGHARHPRPRPARRPGRHDPTVPHVLGDLCRRTEDASRAHRGFAQARRRGTAHGELTEVSASLLGDQLEERRTELRATLPIGRVVEPTDVAALAVHIMTNTALTGATYDIDGGQQLLARG